MIVVHGLGDHGGRYHELAQHLTTHDWSVLAIDLPGHGQSPGTQGRADSYVGLLSDIEHATHTVTQRFPGAKLVLLGHSMGGNLAINYVLRSPIDSRSSPLAPQIDVSGLVLCAPMLLPPAPPQRPHILAAWLTGHFLPWLSVRRPVDASLLTQDDEQAEMIKADPLMHSRITIYLATQLLSQGRWALDHAREIDVPTLIMYGEDDRLIDQGASANVAIRIGAAAELVKWPGMRHDLFHERNRPRVLARLTQWLGQFKTA